MASKRIIVIGASAGGIDALRLLLGHLPGDFSVPIAIVLHTSPQSPGVLDNILDRATPLPVSHPGNGERIGDGQVYVAPPDHHLLVEPGILRVTRGPRENRFRPAVDPLFRSAAQVYGPAAIGVVLTGNLDDGTVGLKAIQQLGGITIVQEPTDALFPSMPEHALRHVKVDYKVPLSQIPSLLTRLVATDVNARREVAVPDDIDVEVKIAGGENPVGVGLERIGEPSRFACPECHGVLLRIKESSPPRFRCHTGHAYSIEALVADVNAGVENALWNALRALEEAGLLSAHLTGHADAQRAGSLAQRFAADAGEIRRQAEILRDLLKHRDTFSTEKKTA